VHVPDQVLYTEDHGRSGSRAFLRLLVTHDAVIVVVHELGPPRGADDGEKRANRWSNWLYQLAPPTLTDDLGTAYAAQPRPSASGQDGSPGHPELPMKATVSWRFLPLPPTEVRRWTIDGRWTVTRAGA
jgi:hypothetical protein